jgi:hypothetical protein
MRIMLMVPRCFLAIDREIDSSVPPRADQELVMNAVSLRTRLALLVGLPKAEAELCTLCLEIAGYQVVRAVHGPAACTLIDALRPTLVVVSRDLWALERRALDKAAFAVAADVVDPAALDRALLALT